MDSVLCALAAMGTGRGARGAGRGRLFVGRIVSSFFSFPPATSINKGWAGSSSLDIVRGWGDVGWYSLLLCLSVSKIGRLEKVRTNLEESDLMTKIGLNRR